MCVKRLCVSWNKKNNPLTFCVIYNFFQYSLQLSTVNKKWESLEKSIQFSAAITWYVSFLVIFTSSIEYFLLYYQRLFWVLVYFCTLPYTISSKWGFTVLLVFIRNENSDQNTISNLGKNNKLSSILKEYYEKG